MKTFTLATSEAQVLGMISVNLIHKIHLATKVIAVMRMVERPYSFQTTPHRWRLSFLVSLSAKNEITCSLHRYSFILKQEK